MNKLRSHFIKQSNTTSTENGAETYRSSLSAVLDFFYHAPARQGDPDNVRLFWDAFEENRNLALKALFYIRDARQGKKQKATFQYILAYLHANEPRIFDKIVVHVPEFGYWKELMPYYGSKVVVDLVREQLEADMTSDFPSLLGKWMPSENTSSKDTVQLATRWRNALHMKSRNYRKMLSTLRERIGVVERDMSKNNWRNIEYERVPSRAMKNLKDAFARHDGDRFNAYIESTLSGETKMNSSMIYPHEIVEYFLGSGSDPKKDKVHEAMWMNLPGYYDSAEKSILPLIDVSSSMIGAKAIHIAIALGMFCAERIEGPFRDMFLTFSDHPQIVRIEGKTLRKRVHSVRSADWGGSTDLLAAFKTILRTAIENEVPPADMPTDLLILSDMEFNSPYIGGKNFDAVEEMYAASGYKMPMLTFWNLDSRHKQTPVTKAQENAFLVSGFSTDVIGKILNADATNPEALMLEILNSERYSFIDKIVVK